MARNIERAFDSMKNQVTTELKVMKSLLTDEARIYDAFKQMYSTLLVFFKFKGILEEEMDKKMAKVTTQMKTAERDVKAGKPAAAVKALKGAEKKNVKLTKIDRTVRDPEIKAYKKMKAKGC
jgi:hypothetical protein